MNAGQTTILENSNRQKVGLELLIIFALSITVFIAASHYDILEKIVQFSHKHEIWELDEIITVSIFLVFAIAIFTLRRWIELRKIKIVLLQRNQELQNAISEIKQLRGIIPICSGCKKIRDDEGYWHQVESYVRDHSEATFSHGICPDCLVEMYPECFEDEEQEKNEPS